MTNGRQFDTLATHDADGGSHRLPLLRVDDAMYVGRDAVVVMSDEDRTHLRGAIRTAKAGQVKTEFATALDRRLVMGGVVLAMATGVGGLVIEAVRLLTGR